MQQNIKDLKGKAIVASDGDIGTVDDCYFDDRSWTIRYLVASTGNWFVGKDVTLSPLAIVKADASSGRIEVNLTRRQVDGSPMIDPDKPVASQRESSYYDYYGFPYYWMGPYLWGPLPSPKLTDDDPATLPAEDAPRVATDGHLRSAAKVSGANIEATDGAIGTVEDFIIDDDTWEIRYLVVDAHNWLPGKKVLIAPRWIERVNWNDSTVYVNLSRQAIASGPEYDPQAFNRDYEGKLYNHYDRPKYWELLFTAGSGAGDGADQRSSS